MTVFLEQIAKKLLLLTKDELRNTLVILPNRRAKLYLNKHIANNIDAPIWSPEIISINDFIFNNLNISNINNIELILKLYEVHRKLEQENTQSLDQFTTWAELQLSDFNEIDLYLVSAKKLFTYLSDAKKIEQWDLEYENLTREEKNYLKFYESLDKYYLELKKLLLSEDKAYQGMAYRMMSENFSETKLNYSNIFIAGFNSLSPSEDSIFKKLQSEHGARIFWDIDKYYYNNKSHEAGIPLRRQLANEDISKLSFISDNLSTTSKNINIYGINGNIAQVKFAGQLLTEQFADNNTLEESAVILANEELMIPMISSIPDEINKFNLTMSFPLRLHPTYDIVMNIIDLYKNHNFENDRKTDLNVYYKSFLNFIQHPYIQDIIDSNNNISKDLIHRINKDNISRITINYQYLSKLSSESENLKSLISILNNTSNNTNSILDIIIEIFKLLQSQNSSDLNDRYFSHYIEILSSLRELISGTAYIQKLTTLNRWIQNTINQAPIPFSGEPLSGLQIMGMLETRTLDFKNLIILSVNEGILPNTKPYQSFILFDIKKEFNMPLPSENDAIMAYHFYRLLQRAKNINLIYNTSPGKIQGNEMSRFIKQIELELPQINPNISIKHQMIDFNFQVEDKVQNIEIYKTDAILNKIKKYATEKAFSPSSLNNLKKCSYYFYLQKIVGLKADDIIEEQLAYNTQGTIIHKTLEEFYIDFLNKKITEEYLKNNEDKIFKIFEGIISKDFENLNIKTGRGLITKKILEQYIKGFIKKEKAYISENECTIIGLEENLSKEIDIKIDNEILKVKFGGNADRIDKNKNTIRIIDYKTGKVEEKNVKINKNKKTDYWGNMFTDKLDKAFQLMMYAWMYWDKIIDGFSLESGIIALKNNSNYYPLNIYKNQKISKENIDRFEEDITKLIQDLFNPEIAFSQRKNDRVCENCDFKSICKR
jgi:hypothetical protein